MIDIQWDSKFEVGVQRIDFEHQVFVDLIRSISQAAEQHSPAQRIVRLMQEVRKYAEFHFLSEENIMQDVGYPQYEEHKKEHARLISTLDDRIYDYRHGSHTADAFADFLFQWFALHTTQKDLLLAQHIRQAGVVAE